MPSLSHVLHTTAEQAISRRGNNENVCEMFKDKKCTCKAVKTIVFQRHIFNFVTFLLLWSSCLPLQLHNVVFATDGQDLAVSKIKFHVSYFPTGTASEDLIEGQEHLPPS